MTFLEWEIYSQWGLEEAVKTTKTLIKTANGSHCPIPEKELDALRTLVSLAEHVADRGTLDEATNKWTVE